ncbi:hypothetical protein [Leptospira sp. severe_002]
MHGTRELDKATNAKIKCRPIQGMDRLISFNTDLWQLAKEI